MRETHLGGCMIVGRPPGRTPRAMYKTYDTLTARFCYYALSRRKKKG